MMNHSSTTLENLIGELNDVEKKNAPQELYYCGDPSIIAQSFNISVVGSRKISADVERRTIVLVKAIIARGGTVVSGLAEGVDTVAHTTAIKCGAKTVAVIGTPLNEYYPKFNRQLQETIARDHLLISQFPLGTAVKPKNFPIRNRTMALVSDATVIVEAGEKSGTLHQGWEALRLGRPLFIMESVTLNPLLSWPQEMLKYGANILKRDELNLFFECIPSFSRLQMQRLDDMNLDGLSL